MNSEIIPSYNGNFASKSLVGQPKAKDTIGRTLTSGRLHHAYLLSGPEGSGKKVAALAMAEAINGISNLTEPLTDIRSKKSSWLHHPDIHVFVPIPSQVSFKDVQQRLEMLATDPYSVVDFGHLPEIGGKDVSKNRKSFYPLAYYEKDIRPAAFLTPNEGARTVIIITRIETMRKEVTNAFLKLLEEPPDQVMFILTSDQPDMLLPTIISRCQHIPFTPVAVEDIERNLIESHKFDPGNARYLSRISGGNYAMTRFYDLENLKEQRESIVKFLRASYATDAKAISDQADAWNKDLNSDATIDLLNMMEVLLRDIWVWSHTGSADKIINIDQTDVIQRFSDSLKQARIPEMIGEIADMKAHMVHNVNIRLLFIVLSLRFARLMRGSDVLIPDDRSWSHIPQLS